MTHLKKKFQFQKVLQDYDFMKKYLENNEEKEKLNERVLLLNVENLDYGKCEKIFFLLRHSLTLQSIILKSEVSYTIINDIAKSNEAEKYTRGPVFYTKYVSKTLYQAITDYLYNSDRIKILAFKSIPITCDLPILCQGIRSNRSIRVIQFENCDICDDGCIQICQALRKSPIEVLGLVNCKLTSNSATWIAWLIREQSMLRTLISWNRYQTDYGYKTEQGIRKMIFNDNPGIKDNGAKFIISTLFDDDWITHIHMENTGLSDPTCQLILKLLKQNKSITIFDIDRNHVSSHIIERITKSFSKISSELGNNESRPKSVKKNVRQKKKNTKRKKSKNNFDKLISDKSQQTSEFSFYYDPFILIDSNTHNEKHGSSFLINHFDQKNEDIILESFNNSKLKTSDIQKQFDSITCFHKHYGMEKSDRNKKGLQATKKLKEKRTHFSINQNAIDQKDFRKNNSAFESYNDVTKGCKWLQSKNNSSFKV